MYSGPPLLGQPYATIDWPSPVLLDSLMTSASSTTLELLKGAGLGPLHRPISITRLALRLCFTSRAGFPYPRLRNPESQPLHSLNQKRERQPPELAYVRPVESGGDAPIWQLGLATFRTEASPIVCGGELLQAPADRIPPGALTLPTKPPVQIRRGLGRGPLPENKATTAPACCWVAGAGGPGRLKMQWGDAICRNPQGSPSS